MKPYSPEIKPRAVKPKAPRPKYQWPANKITSEEMAILFRLRESTGMPINKLLQEAIQKLGEAMNGASESLAQAGRESSEQATSTAAAE